MVKISYRLFRNMTIPVGRSDFTFTQIDERNFIVYGGNGIAISHTSETCWKLQATWTDPPQFIWRSIPTDTMLRHGHGAVWYDEQLYSELLLNIKH